VTRNESTCSMIKTTGGAGGRYTGRGRRRRAAAARSLLSIDHPPVVSGLRSQYLAVVREQKET
jgi:hypothetical protein